MVDHVPLERPRPRLATLTLLVGRVTTIKLGYWAALTAAEVALGLVGLPDADRARASLAVAALATLAACAWAAWSARATDPRAGALERSLPTVATVFIAASVVATPASLPLLFVEVKRQAIWYWVGAVALGTLLIPLVFALRMRVADQRP